jgi:HSP20 family protein
MRNLPSLLHRESAPTLWQPLTRLQRQVDRLFSDFMSPISDVESDLSSMTVFSPACDVTETDNSYQINFDIPGVKKDDVKVELRDNVLSVSGERKSDQEKKGRNRYLRECCYGAFERSFTLPSKVNASKVQAEFKDGSLQIEVPKTQASQAQRIEIREGQCAQQSQRIDTTTAH